MPKAGFQRTDFLTPCPSAGRIAIIPDDVILDT